MNRRSFLIGLSSLIAASKLKAFGKSSLFEVGILKHDKNHDIRNNGIKKVLWEVAKRTSVEVSFETPSIDINDKLELFKHPFLYFTGNNTIDFSDKQIENLKSYLEFGGFLFIDSNEGVMNGLFHKSVEKLISKLYTSENLKILSKDSIIYRTFNLLDKPYGRISIDNDFYGIEKGKRIEVLYSQNDIMGACSKDLMGNWEYGVVGGDYQREMAFRTGINIVMYANCLDYKLDQVHIEYLLNSRK